MKRVILFSSLLCFCLIATAQKTDKRLQEKVAELLQGFNGEVGVYIHDLKKNRIAAVHADTIFPTASMVKVPILTGIMRKMESGELQYHQTLTYKDSLLYAGVDILGSLKNNEKIEMSKVMM
ncbi:MAG: serine hydrolase, partial [Sediminibacterium sp.]|nr:serine hydrolase [Sediminibacterium sp.]